MQINHRVLFLTDNCHATESWLVGLEQFAKSYSVTVNYRPTVLIHEAANFDLIVIVVETPTIAEALQTCQRLRAWTNKPILMVSALDDEEFALMVYKAGADEYVLKSISHELLHAKLKAWQRWLMPQKRWSLLPVQQVLKANI